jgi:L-fucose mutarotase/ribose pyranase (RbsD/FucU family)
VLETELLHPPLLAALAAAGHGDHIVIADANFPLRTATDRSVDVVHLNLRPGLVGVLADHVLHHVLLVPSGSWVVHAVRTPTVSTTFAHNRWSPVTTTTATPAARVRS